MNLRILIVAFLLVLFGNHEVFAQNLKKKRRAKTTKKEKISPQPAPEVWKDTRPDTVYHYFKGTKILSAKEATPKGMGWFPIYVYNRQGKEVFKTQRANFSFHVSAELRFYEDGGVSDIFMTTHPDAGIYEGRSQIHFSEKQAPMWETHAETMPGGTPKSLSDVPTTYIYKADGTKVKQEVIGCQPPMPRD